MQQLKNLNNYGLLVDLDGTIIQNNEFISLRVKKSIKKLSGHIPVSIVTGRGPQDVLKFSKQLDLFGPQYCENGTSVVDAISKKILDVSLISDEISSEIIKGFMNSKMEYLVVSNGKTYINPSNILKNVSSLVLSSFTLKGVVLDVFSIVRSLAIISISPVDISGLSVPSSLFFTIPCISSTYSERKV